LVARNLNIILRENGTISGRITRQAKVIIKENHSKRQLSSLSKVWLSLPQHQEVPHSQAFG
jgi:hypothetical protein